MLDSVEVALTSKRVAATLHGHTHLHRHIFLTLRWGAATIKIWPQALPRIVVPVV